MADLTGYAGQLLEVNLTSQTSRPLPLDPALARDFIGGRALGMKMLWDEYGSNWADVDPLGPDSVLLILVGPTNGFAPGKTVSVFKSPLNGGAIASAVSGDMNAMIRFAGYDGMIIRGRADAPVYLYVEDDKVEIRDARSLWGMNTREIHRVLMADTDPATQFLYIGPAGEKLVKFAVIMSNWYKACGRGGSGAVMGSKNLKAIAVKGNRPLPEIADPDTVAVLMNKLHKEVPVNMAFMHEYGTTGILYHTAAELSAEPIRNWQEEWHDREETRVEHYADDWQRRYWSDYACTLACCKIGRIKEGPHAGEIFELPDFEGAAFVGPNFDIYNSQDIPYLADLFDIWGMDVISGPSVIGWAAELYQRGILTKADLGGVDLAWGNAEAFAQMTEKVARREGIGDTLAEGLLGAAKIIGKDSERYAVHVKGIEVGAHGVRSGKDYTGDPISYALSTQGGDHTSIAGEAGESWYLEDTLVLCGFWSLGSEVALELLNASTGFDVTEEELNTTLVPRWVALQRTLLILAGWGHEDDTNPPRFYEPLPSGPHKGMKVDKTAEQKSLQEAYRARGWDKRGIPTSETLERLGLPYLDAVLDPYR
jgi:aldehyde:ferredoxin oxidoreductase